MEKIKNFPSQNESKTELLLISSLTPDFVDFIDKNFADEISEDALGNYLNELVEKIDRKKTILERKDLSIFYYYFITWLIMQEKERIN